MPTEATIREARTRLHAADGLLGYASGDEDADELVQTAVHHLLTAVEILSPDGPPPALERRGRRIGVRR